MAKLDQGMYMPMELAQAAIVHQAWEWEKGMARTLTESEKAEAEAFLKEKKVQAQAAELVRRLALRRAKDQESA